MPARLSRQEATFLKEKLLSSIGVPYSRVANSVYHIHGRRVNVKITSRRKSGRYWFNIQRRNVDSYIWICYIPETRGLEAFYWIPAEEMWSYVSRRAYKDRTWERAGHPIANFEVDTKRDLYIGGPQTQISIRQFRGQRFQS
ncbi:MAG: hypothetical protein NWF11_07295 [Candidatus Bathyarchaeota archaeon]|nr:hypothetical protein [Candidatus Bathyarchaeota archaeon]